MDLFASMYGNVLWREQNVTHPVFIVRELTRQLIIFGKRFYRMMLLAKCIQGIVM